MKKFLAAMLSTTILCSAMAACVPVNKSGHEKYYF